jgi:DNA phosphorothioation-dependent restriction protein DptG
MKALQKAMGILAFIYLEVQPSFHNFANERQASAKSVPLYPHLHNLQISLKVDYLQYLSHSRIVEHDVNLYHHASRAGT